jgi:chemotaxis protein CheD
VTDTGFPISKFIDVCATPAAHVLHPGDVASGRRGDRFETLLGSCVALVLTDPRRTFGAMCHIVHAGTAGAANAGDTRGADAALEAMRRHVAAHGMHLACCEAWVCGGGNMFRGLVAANPVGERNVHPVLAFLRAERVRLIDIDVGGAAYRRLRWTVGPAAPELTVVAV